MSDASDRAPRAAAALLVVVVAASVLLRVYALDRLPGINGDEAWYGVLLQRLLAGEPFQWRTPSGNLPGPVHLLLLGLLQPILPRSFAVLRLPAVLSSLAQALVLWLCVRKLFGKPAALVALVLAAALPVDLAYARFGWDPSHVPLVTTAAACFALRGNPWASAALYGLAIAVHPASAFLGAFLVVALLLSEVPRAGWLRAARRSGVHLALLLGALAAVLSISSGSGGRELIEGASGRVLDPRVWGELALLYVRFLSGDTVYEYVAGGGLGSARTAADLGVGLLLLALTAVGGWRLLRRAPGAEIGIVAGWLVTLMAFFVLAGPHGLRPHLERYAMVLVAPTLLAATVLLREVGAWVGRAWVPMALAGAVAALALTGFSIRYLGALERTGSTSHPTFWTGPVEPKAETFRRIAEEAGRAGGAAVIAEDFWTYQALAYLAHGTLVDVRRAEDPPRAPPPGGTYWVGFAGGPLERWALARPSLLPRWDVSGASGRTVLRVWWTPAFVTPFTGQRAAGAPH